MILTQEADIRRVLKAARVVAVLGAHASPERPAHYVPDYLASQGSRILAVNPMIAGETLWGGNVRASLTELGEPVDVVDVFRRSDLLPGHVAEILGMNPRPRVVWFQSGVRNDAVADALSAEGIDVIQDRCMLADHRAMGIGRIG
jgi:predicted CoA-binding protein